MRKKYDQVRVHLRIEQNKHRAAVRLSPDAVLQDPENQMKYQ